MTPMLEHAPDLSWLDPAGGEVGQFVFGEEGDFAGFEARARLASGDLAQGKHLVDIERVWRRVAVSAPVPHGAKFDCAGAEPRLFLHLPRDALAGRLVDVGPAARQRPAPVVAFADHQHAPIAKCRTPDIDPGASHSRCPGETGR